ncbi:unnamed protein product, partial [Symbiodinium microadriaticum]
MSHDRRREADELHRGTLSDASWADWLPLDIGTRCGGVDKQAPFPCCSLRDVLVPAQRGDRLLARPPLFPWLP